MSLLEKIYFLGFFITKNLTSEKKIKEQYKGINIGDDISTTKILSF